MTDRTILAPVKERHFRFESGSGPVPWAGPRVQCMNCGWSKAPGWRDHQRVFDLSCGHECPGVETYEHMLARERAERLRDRAGRVEFERSRIDLGAPHWTLVDEADKETWRRQAEAKQTGDPT